ncbi:hypothetical protein OAG1_41640 [Agarivorans sp. OAG1]|nr:hypothetical protein OAG1_41640 [Agarivorans sp. OAG1]
MIADVLLLTLKREEPLTLVSQTTWLALTTASVKRQMKNMHIEKLTKTIKMRTMVVRAMFASISLLLLVSASLEAKSFLLG